MRPGYCLGDGGSVGGIVLLAALDIGFDARRWDQSDLMAQINQPTRPMMSCRAGFHADQTRRQSSKELFNGRSSELLANDHPAGLINPVDLKDMLGKIEPDGNNGHVDGPPECGGFDIAILWHLDAGGTAVVHTIKSEPFVSSGLERIDREFGPKPGRTTKPVVLVIDNGPIHTSKASRKAMAARSAWLTPEWLPKYAPELNDIEHAWRDLKRHFLAHQTFGSVNPCLSG